MNYLNKLIIENQVVCIQETWAESIKPIDESIFIPKKSIFWTPATRFFKTGRASGGLAFILNDDLNPKFSTLNERISLIKLSGLVIINVNSSLSSIETWGKEIEGRVIIFPENLDKNIDQTKSIVKYMHDNFLNEYDWFLIFDDQTFINTQNLVKLLETLNPLENKLIAPRTVINEEKKTECFQSKDLIISRELLKNVGLVFDKCIHWNQCLEMVDGVNCELTNKIKHLFRYNQNKKVSNTFDDKVLINPLKDKEKYKIFNKKALMKIKQLTGMIKSSLSMSGIKKSSQHFESFIENKYYGIEQKALSKIDSKLRSWIVRKLKNVQISKDSNCTASSSEPKTGYIRDSVPAGFDLIIKSKLNCQDKKRSLKENNILVKARSGSLLMRESNQNSLDKAINFILPVYERHSAFKRFLSFYEENCLKQNESTTLTVVLFQPNSSIVSQENLKNIILFKELNEKYRDSIPANVIKMNTENSAFSRALAGNIGASNYSPNSLLFFIDLDMVFIRDLLSRIRLNTIKNKQVYFPIVFSQYNPKFIQNMPNKSLFQINSDLGYWRHFGFGMVSAYKSDFDRIGKFNTKFKGWGGEDFDLYSRFKRSKLTIFRASEPGLVHVFHDFKCSLTNNNIQKNSCLGSSSNTQGSQRS